MKSTDGALSFDAVIRNTDFKRSIDEMEAKIKGLTSTAQKQGSDMEATFSKLAAVAGTAFAGVGLAGFVTQLVSVRAEFQSLDASFTTMLGSKAKANELMNQIKQSALTTPFEVKELATGAKSLLAYGIAAEDVNATMLKLGDVASGLNIPFTELTQIYGKINTQGRLFAEDINQLQGRGIPIVQELAKTYGKSTEQIKLMVEAGKIGFKDVEVVLNNLTGAGGMFYKSMEAQSKTLNGQISNMQDAWSNMLNALGTESEGVLSGAITGATSLINNYESVIEAIKILIVMYGSYKAAIIATSTLEMSATSAKAAEMAKLLSAEQMAKVSKLELSTTSVAYANAIKAEVEANVLAAQITVQRIALEKEQALAEQIAIAQKIPALTAEMEAKAANMVLAGQSGNALAYETAQKELNTASSKVAAAVSKEATLAKTVETLATEEAAAKNVVETLSTQVGTVAKKGEITWSNLLAASKLKLTAVTQALNAAIMANPFAVAAASVALLSYGIYKLITYQNDLERAQTRVNESLAKFNEESVNNKAAADALFAQLNAATKGTEEYSKAKQAIIDQYGTFLEGNQREKEALIDSGKAYALVTKEIEKQARAKYSLTATQNAYTEYGKIEKESIDDLYSVIQKRIGDKVGADGIKMSETIWAKIKPVLLGLKEMTPEIEALIKENFDTTEYVSGGVAGTSTKYIDNAVLRQMDQLKKARAAKDWEIAEINKKYTSPTETKDDQTFDPLKASLGQLDAQLIKTTDLIKDMNSAKANGEPFDEKNLKDSIELTKVLEDNIKKREKELYIIDDVSARIKQLDSQKGNYGKDDKKLVELDKRIATLREKLPVSEKEKNKDAKAEEEAYEKSLEEKKKLYAAYQKWIDAYGQESADKQFAELIKNGQGYIDYLEKEKARIKSDIEAGKGGKDGAKNLDIVENQLLDVKTGKSQIERFGDDLKDAKANAASLTAYMVRLNEEKAKLGKSGSNSDFAIQAKGLIETETQIAVKEQKALVKSFLKEVVNTKEKEAAINKKYASIEAEINSQTSELTVSQKEQALAKVKALRDRDMEEVKLENFHNLESFKKLMAGVEDHSLKGMKATKDALLVSLEDLKKLGLEGSSEFKALENDLKNVTLDIDEATIRNYESIAQMAGEIGVAMEGWGGSLAGLGALLSGVASQAGNLANTIKAVNNKDTVGAVSRAVSGAVNLANIVVSSAQQRKEAEEAYRESIVRSRQEMALFANDIILNNTNKNGNLFIKDFANRAKDATKSMVDAKVNLQKSLDALDGGRAKKGQRNAVDWKAVGNGAGSGATVGAVIGSVVPVVGTAIGAVVGGIVGGVVGLFGGKKKKDSFGGLLAEYPELISKGADGVERLNKELAQTLINNNMVDEGTKGLLQSSIEWSDQVEKASEEIKGIVNDLAGGLGDGIRNALVDAFEAGTDSAKAFQGEVEKVMESIITQMMFDAFFKESFDTLQKDMTNSLGSINGDGNVVDDLDRFNKETLPKLDQFNQQLAGVKAGMAQAGYTILEGSKSENDKAKGLEGAIKSITSDQANLIGGQMNAIRMNQAESLMIVRQQLLHMSEIAINTRYLKSIDASLTALNKSTNNSTQFINRLNP